jgi:hypothetical protein
LECLVVSMDAWSLSAQMSHISWHIRPEMKIESTLSKQERRRIEQIDCGTSDDTLANRSVHVVNGDA